MRCQARKALLSPHEVEGKVVAPATKREAADRQHKTLPLNQPALWAEPEPPRAKPDGGLNLDAAGV